MAAKIKLYLIPVTAMIIGMLFGLSTSLSSPEPAKKEFLIKARQYAYDPPVIEVNRGDTLKIRLVSLDVVHGFFVEGYDIDAEIFANKKKFNFRHPSQGDEWTETDEIELIADKTGKFRYRCSHTCGTMHPFMQGELIVLPNVPYNAGVGSVIGLFFGMILMLFRKGKKLKAADNSANVKS